MLLSAIKHIEPKARPVQIQHLPLVLVHQAQKNLKRGYTPSMLAKLHQLFFELANQNNEPLLKITKGKADNLFHLHYAIPKPWPLVSLIIPTRDALNLTRTCVNSILFLTQYPHYEIIIIDMRWNGSPLRSNGGSCRTTAALRLLLLHLCSQE